MKITLEHPTAKNDRKQEIEVGLHYAEEGPTLQELVEGLMGSGEPKRAAP